MLTGPLLRRQLPTSSSPRLRLVRVLSMLSVLSVQQLSKPKALTAVLAPRVLSGVWHGPPPRRAPPGRRRAQAAAAPAAVAQVAPAAVFDDDVLSECSDMELDAEHHDGDDQGEDGEEDGWMEAICRGPLWPQPRQGGRLGNAWEHCCAVGDALHERQRSSRSSK